MNSISATALNGSVAVLDAGAVKRFMSAIEGNLFVNGDPEYDTFRKVWNGMIDHHPAMIVQCKNASDVSKCVKFAGDNSILVSVKCGGHNFAGFSVAEGGLMIDLSLMRNIEVDPIGKSVKAGGGVLLGDLDKATQVYGLATTSGTVSHTGIGGLTLGGGQGWIMNKYGLTCDNLLSAEIVTSDGNILTVSASQNEDLFWAIRGGGGNFGVVTSFEYKLHPVGPNIIGGMIIYPVSILKKVLQFFRQYSMSTPDELTMMAGILCLPDGTQAVAMAAGWIGAAEEGKKLMQPIKDLDVPLADMLGDIPYVQLQTLFDAAVPHYMPRYGKMGYMQELSDEVIDIVIDHSARHTSPNSVVLFNTMKGAVSRIAPDATPFFYRKPQWHFDIVAQWTDASEEAKHIGWARNFWNDIAKYTTGASINFFGTDDGQDRVKASFGSNYQRLSSIKAKYDPRNLFRLNANILPAEKTVQSY